MKEFFFSTSWERNDAKLLKNLLFVPLLGLPILKIPTYISLPVTFQITLFLIFSFIIFIFWFWNTFHLFKEFFVKPTGQEPLIKILSIDGILILTAILLPVLFLIKLYLTF